MFLASGPISLGKGGSFFNILLWCVRQINMEAIRFFFFKKPKKLTAASLGESLLGDVCVWVVVSVHGERRPAGQKLIHQNTQAPPVYGLEDKRLPSTEGKKHNTFPQQKLPCRAPTLPLLQFLEPYIQQCHTQKRPFPPVSDKKKVMTINAWVLCRWALEQRRNWGHLIKLFTHPKVCQNYMTAWIQENIFQF